MALRQAIQFEIETIAALQRQFKWSLQHTGRAGDHGIDFRTAFYLPNTSKREETYTIVGQCKYLQRTHVLPKDIRELEGVVARERMLLQRASDPANVIGVLAFDVTPNAARVAQQAEEEEIKEDRLHDDLSLVMPAPHQPRWPISAASMNALRTSPLPLAACLMQSVEGVLRCIKIHCNASVPAALRHFCESSIP